MTTKLEMLQNTAVANFETRFRKGLSQTENPDPLISRKGMEYIEGIEGDTHLSSVLDTRAQSVLAKGWRIRPHTTTHNGKQVITARDAEIRDFVEYCLKRIPSFDSDLRAMFDAVGKGFSISEKNLELLRKGKYKGKIALKNIRLKPAKNFSFEFDDYGNYKLIQVDPVRKELDLNKFIHFISGKDDENPYGESVSSKAAFWAWLKKNGAKFWAIYAERYGKPLSVVDVPENLEPGSQAYKKAEEVLTAMLQDEGILKPKNFEIKYLEAMRDGNVGFDSFIERCNKEMSKVGFGNTLTNEEGKRGQGSYALGSVHQETKNAYIMFDIIMSSSAINGQLIRWLVDLNYDTDYYPTFEWKTFDVNMLITIAQNIANLANAGLRIPVRSLYEAIGIDVPEADEECLKPTGIQPQQEKSKQLDNKAKSKMYDNDDLEQFIDDDIQPLIEQNENFVKEVDRTEAWYREQWAQIMDGVRELLSKQKKFDAEALKNYIDDALPEVIQQFLAISYLQGRSHASRQIELALSIAKFADEKKVDVYKPFDQVLAEFLKKNVITRDEFDLLEQEFKRRAFTIAGVESVAILESVKAAIAKVGDNGWPEVVKTIDLVFDNAGLSRLNPYHMNTVIRTNIQTMYSQGKEVLYSGMDTEEFPARMVVCVLDSRTRESHKAFHHFTYAADNPIWQKLRTPFDYNCRCTIILLHKSMKYSFSASVPDTTKLRFVK